MRSSREGALSVSSWRVCLGRSGQALGDVVAELLQRVLEDGELLGLPRHHLGDGVIHDFVMLDPLRDTSAKKAAMTLATDALRAALA